MKKIYKVGLIGCGHIAETYFRAHNYFNNFKIIKCADIKKEVSDRCAKINKIKSLTVEKLLKDGEIASDLEKPSQEEIVAEVTALTNV